ncbi:MAG: AsmA family protein [Bacteroidales bacterium]|nr:AsmA family protein [Bacteroidales bacterium]
MKKALKIGLISLGSLLAVVILAAAILLFHIFSPSKLAKMVNNQADRFITCDFHIDKAGLTFFKTFPKVGLELENVVLKNPKNPQVSDTLLYAKECVAALNIRELIQNNRLELYDFSLNQGLVNMYIDENGNGNYKVFRTDPNDTSSFNYSIDLQKVKAKEVDVRYLNLQSRQKAELQDADLSVKGTFKDNEIDGQAELEAKSLAFVMADSTRLHFSGDDVKASYDGSFTDFNLLDGKVEADIENAVLCLDTTHYLNGMDLNVASEVKADLKALQFDLQKTTLQLDKQELTINGHVDMDTVSRDIHTDLHYRTGDWKIDEILPLIPDALIGNKLDDIQISGDIALEGDVKGTFSDTQKPLITSDVAWHHGRFAMKDLPLDFEKADGLFDFRLDLNNQSDLIVKSLSATTRKRNKITATGTVKNLLGKMLCNILATGKLHIDDFKDLLPEDFTQYKGQADLQVKTQLAYDPQKDFSIDNITKAVINGQFTDLELLYHDTTTIRMPDLHAEIEFPVTNRPYRIDEWLNAKLKTSSLLVFNHPEKITITADDLQLDAYTNNLLDDAIDLKFATTYLFDLLTVNYEDTITAYLHDSKGKFILNNTNQMQLDYNGNKISGMIGSIANTYFAETLNLQVKTDYKEKEENPLLRWSPVVKLQLSKAQFDAQELTHLITVPALDIDFNPQKCVLKKANIGYGESKASVTGTITGIADYLQDKGLLKGDLELVANYLNLNELMAMVNGINAPDSLTAQAEEVAKESGDSPFIVPFGVDVNMNTTIQKALYEETEFNNIAGRVYVKDGVLVLEEVGLTNEAARMQLTAMYRTPRMNHLFLGFDFHLLDIKIDKLIAMIPEVDTILPMLKAFSGNAEFHFAAETYLKSNYDIKFSTLRGAAAINGHDLVVLDNETYKTIAKKLMFSKKTQNKIDSLSTEITIFRNEVDVYPFLLSIDKYSAIISGRHNLDLTYDYNISLVKPIRIGLDIIGLDDRLKFKVGKAKYATLFVPEKRKVVESNVLELKTLINKTLQANVRP